MTNHVMVKKQEILVRYLYFCGTKFALRAKPFLIMLMIRSTFYGALRFFSRTLLSFLMQTTFFKKHRIYIFNIVESKYFFISLIGENIDNLLVYIRSYVAMYLQRYYFDAILLTIFIVEYCRFMRMCLYYFATQLDPDSWKFKLTKSLSQAILSQILTEFGCIGVLVYGWIWILLF